LIVLGDWSWRPKRIWRIHLRTSWRWLLSCWPWYASFVRACMPIDLSLEVCVGAEWFWWCTNLCVHVLVQARDNKFKELEAVARCATAQVCSG
jgi:hypothetical protein